MGSKEDEKTVKDVITEMLRCRECARAKREPVGILLPLSDYGQEGAAIIFKAWACSHPECGWNIRVDKGEVTYGKRVEAKVDRDREERQHGRGR